MTANNYINNNFFYRTLKGMNLALSFTFGYNGGTFE